VDWKLVLEKAGGVMAAFAPTLGAVLGGPLGGTAGAILAEILTGDPDANPEEVAARLGAPSLELLSKLKAADAEFKKALLDAGVKLEELATQDRASARQREIDLGDSLTPRLLATGITCGFFAVLAWMLYAGVPIEGGEALLVMLGALGTAWAGVVSYYFGSSAGSAAKTRELARMAETRGAQ